MDYFTEQLEELSKPLLHTVPDTSPHELPSVEKTDYFLCSVYNYYCKKGFLCIILDEILNIMRVIFLAVFIAYLSLCVNFEWWNKKGLNNSKSITKDDIFIPTGICLAEVHQIHLVMFSIATIYSIIKAGLLLYRIPFLLKIRNFFIHKLKMNSSELSVTSWERIQDRLIQVSSNSEESNVKLDELLCHNMILRYTNFIVALINCNILNFYLNIPLIGKIGCFTNLMELYLFKLFFPFACFDGAIFSTRINISELYRAGNVLNYIQHNFRNRIVIISILGLILSPFLFILQLFYIIFEYAEMIRQSPSSILKYRWSRIAYYSLRNYSEFDHELQGRLDTAYPFANSYLKCFSSPLLNVLARHITYFSGAFLLIFFILTLLHDSFLQVNGIVTIITITTAIYAFGSNLENERNDPVPDKHLMNLAANLYHFIPDYEKPLETLSKFKMLFQSQLSYLLEQILAPFTAPLIFILLIRKKIPRIISFVSAHTIKTDVGDMCTYSLLNIEISGKHVNEKSFHGKNKEPVYVGDDKFETSLLSFSKHNKNWNPPKESKKYLDSVNNEVMNYMSQSKRNRINAIPETYQEFNQPNSEINIDSVSRTSNGTLLDLSSLYDSRQISPELQISIIQSRIRRQNLK